MNQDQLIEELRKLGLLHDSGVLSDEEFKEMKQKLLNHHDKSFHLTDPQKGNSGNFENGSISEKSHTGNEVPKSQKKDETISSTSTKKSTNLNIAIKKPQISKRTLWIIGGLGLVIGCLVLFLCLHKSDYQKALDSIEQEQGKILSDVQDKKEHILVYATNNGLYLWNLENKRPQKLYSNLDSLVEYRYWSNFENHKIEQSELTLKERDEDGDITRIFSVSPKSLYRVIWPWILIGKHYVANAYSPSQLFQTSFSKTSHEFDGLPYMYNEEETSDAIPDSVGFDNDGNLVIYVYNNNNYLPGFNEYKPKFVDQETWNNSRYIDPTLLSAYGYLFPEHQRPYYIGIPIDRPYFTTRTITIDKSNRVKIAPTILWGNFSFDEKDMTSAGMIPIYQKIEQNYINTLNDKLSEKKQQLEKFEEEYLKQKTVEIEQNAIDVDDITRAYVNNTRRAIEMYPVHHSFILKASFDKIQYLNFAQTGYMYRLDSNDVFTNIYYLSNDTQFQDLDYPCTLYINAILDDYKLERNFLGSSATDASFLFKNAELLLKQ